MEQGHDTRRSLHRRDAFFLKAIVLQQSAGSGFAYEVNYDKAELSETGISNQIKAGCKKKQNCISRNGLKIKPDICY